MTKRPRDAAHFDARDLDDVRYVRRIAKISPICIRLRGYNPPCAFCASRVMCAINEPRTQRRSLSSWRILENALETRASILTRSRKPNPKDPVRSRRVFLSGLLPPVLRSSLDIHFASDACRIAIPLGDFYRNVEVETRRAIRESIMNLF